MVHTPAGDREGERKRDLSPTHTSRRQRKIEEERTSRNTWYSGRISLCIRPERDAERGFRPETQTTSPDPAENPDDLARSGRKPTHTGVGLIDPALHLWHSLPSSRSRRSIEISSPVWINEPKKERPFRLKCWRIAFCFTLRVVVRPAGVQIEGLYAFFAWPGNMRCGKVQIRIILTCFSIRVIFFRRF
jgi:hypothetical protein